MGGHAKMGILDWFINRPAQFDPDKTSDELIQRAIDKAILLANPRFKLIRDCRTRLQPAVCKTIDYLRAAILALPESIAVSPANWVDTPSLRAFFVSNQDIQTTVGRSKNLHTLFAKYPDAEKLYFVLGMACEEQKVFGLAMRGDVVQREVAQTVLVFSDHQARICGLDEREVRRLVGVQAFEYLIAEVLAQSGAERTERRELEETRSLLRARLRLLEQQGPGLGSLFTPVTSAASEKTRLEAELIENERQLEECVPAKELLEAEFEILCSVLSAPMDYLVFDARQSRIDTLNVVIDGDNAQDGREIAYSLVRGSGVKRGQRAFVLGQYARSDLKETGLDLAQAARML